MLNSKEFQPGKFVYFALSAMHETGKGLILIITSKTEHT